MEFIKNKFKLMIFIFLSSSLFVYLLFSNKQEYSNWEFTKRYKQDWINFNWVKEEIDGKIYDKSAMNVYCKINGYSNTFSFQLDLGAELTGIYENSFLSLPEKKTHSIRKLKSSLLFLNHDKFINDIQLKIGKLTLTSEKCCVYNEMGNTIKSIKPTDTIHIGTIGRDVFKNKTLIIDYKNHRFKILNKTPKQYLSQLISISIDRTGKIILPLIINKRKLKVTFDTGSSLFPLITYKSKSYLFPKGPCVDTLTISSWGKKHDVTSYILSEPIILAGQTYKNVKLYVNHSGLGIDMNSDCMTGNALFFEKTIIIDFKKKLFGVIND